MTTEPTVSLNGRLVPFSQAGLSLHDAGFVVGATVTERLRTFSGRPFRLQDHLLRFRQSCELARVPQPRDDAELTETVHTVIEANRSLGSELAILIFATPGPLGLFGGTDSNGPPTLGVYALPLKLSRFRTLFASGGEVEFSTATIPPSVLDPRIKHRSRLHWWIAEQSNPLPSRYLLYVSGITDYVRETSAANFLTVIGGNVISPPRDRVLSGIALATIEEICLDAGIPFEERELTTAEVVSGAEECWLTNSTFGVAGLSRIGGSALPWPGPLLIRVQRAYSERTGVDLSGQILNA